MRRSIGIEQSDSHSNIQDKSTAAADQISVLRVLVATATEAPPATMSWDPKLAEVHFVHSLESLEEAITQHKPHAFLFDAELTTAMTLETVSRIKQVHSCLVGMLAPAPTGDMITLADHYGVDTLLVKPVDLVQLQRIALLESQQVPYPKDRQNLVRLAPVVTGSSVSMREVWRLVLLAAQSSSSVILAGETGVGKEMAARALHRFSARRSGPFVAVNCAAIPENLLESELFGHERGAFTGALYQHKGRFEAANGGTLFLDEIGDLPLNLQVKLLRVLQERSFERVGGQEMIQVDVRVVAATHKNLEEEVQRQRFRADLYYRLNVLSVRVPPLRERKADILSLWDALLQEGTLRERRAAPTTSAAVRRALLSHEWPGNIRELNNVAQHVLTLATGNTVFPADLPEYLSRMPGKSPTDSQCVGMTLREIERLAIVQTYEALGSISEAAEMLDISPRKIHYRLKEYREQGWLSNTRAASFATPAPHPASAKFRVLLAEDDDELRWILTDFLKSEGYEVASVSDGKGLLEHLGTSMLLGQGDFPADLIVTDIRMPGLSGMQILERIRQRGWKIPIVLISAYGDDKTKHLAERLDATFISKPIDVVALQRAIEKTGALQPS